MNKKHSRSYGKLVLCGFLGFAILGLACAKEVNKPGKPVANAGPDQAVSVKTWVQLDGSASTPSAPGRQLAYEWSFRSRPLGSGALLNDSESVSPVFFADKEGDYTVVLVVNDGIASSDPDDVVITVDACGNNAPVSIVGLLLPMVVPASSVISFTQTDGILIQLDGSSSYDADNFNPCSLSQTLSYQWAFSLLPPGSSAILNNNSVSNPSFTPDVPGLYELLLQVADSTGKISSFAQADFNVLPSTVEGPGAGLYSSLKLDPAGNPLVAYYDFLEGDLRYAVLSGNTWSTQSVDIIGNVGEYASLALSPTGSLPRISYRDATTGSLKYASWDGSQWLLSFADVQRDAGRFSSVKLDGNGIVKVAYYDATAQDLMYAVFNGANSYTVSTVDSTGDVGQFVSMALDGSGRPMIAYYDASNGDLKYAVCTSGCESASPAWLVSTVDSAGNVGQFASIGISSTTYPNISYYSGNALKFAACTANCSTAAPTWTIVTVDVGGGVGQWTSLSISSTTGRPRISYYDQGNRILKYAVCTAGCNTMGGTWVSGVADGFGVVNVGQYTSIAEFNGGPLEGLPAVSYYDVTNQNLKLAICTAGCNAGVGNWISIPLDTTGGNEGQSSSLAMLSGTPVISYYDVDNQDLRIIAFGYGDFLLDTNGDVGRSTSLNMSASGQWMVSYYDATNGALKLAEYLPPPQDRVRFHTVDGSNTVGLYTSLALDGSGNPSIAYHVPPGQLRYALCTAGCGTTSPTWAVNVVDVIDNVGQYSSMLLAAGGIPRITYYDAVNGDLKYALCSGGCTGAGATWTISSVESAGIVGQYTSLALNPAGDTRVSYLDVANGSLRYAECTEGCSTTSPTWSISTVDTIGNVGVGTSLALTASGEPRIAYYDATSGDLKYASGSGSIWSISRLSTIGNVGINPSLVLSSTEEPRITYLDTTNLTLRYYSYGD